MPMTQKRYDRIKVQLALWERGNLDVPEHLDPAALVGMLKEMRAVIAELIAAQDERPEGAWSRVRGWFRG